MAASRTRRGLSAQCSVMARFDVAVGDVALDRLDEQRAASVELQHLGVKDAVALVAADDVAGTNRGLRA
jgi:hypothetical protein